MSDEAKRLDDVLAGAKFLEAQLEVYRSGLMSLLKYAKDHEAPRHYEGGESDNPWAWELDRRVTEIITDAAKVSALTF